jgi:hypothetical protein
MPEEITNKTNHRKPKRETVTKKMKSRKNPPEPTYVFRGSVHYILKKKQSLRTLYWSGFI